MEIQNWPTAGNAATMENRGARSASKPREARRSASLDPIDAAAILVAVGEVAYVWDLATDELCWSPNALDVLGVATLASLRSGRIYAALLDPESPANRYDSITGSSARDEGKGVAYELHYSLRPPDAAETRWVEDTGRWFARPRR